VRFCGVLRGMGEEEREGRDIIYRAIAKGWCITDMRCEDVPRDWLGILHTTYQRGNKAHTYRVNVLFAFSTRSLFPLLLVPSNSYNIPIPYIFYAYPFHIPLLIKSRDPDQESEPLAV
jgi:hypothetical protein